MVLVVLPDFLEFLLLHNKLPQIEQLKTRHISYLTSSMGQESMNSLAGLSAVKGSIMARIASESQWTKYLFPRSQGFGEGCSSLQVIGLETQFLGGNEPQAALGPLQNRPLHILVYFTKTSKEGVSRESLATRHEVIVFCNIITEVISHYLCCILLIEASRGLYKGTRRLDYLKAWLLRGAIR